MLLRTLYALIPIATLLACARATPSQTIAATSDTARISRVILHGLRPRIDVVGQPVRWTLQERMAFHQVPGVSIAFIEGGDVVWARGFGVREDGKTDEVTSATLFQAGSISKPVAVSAMLRLVQQGVVDLDTDVNQYLTSWRVPDNRFTQTEPVTLRRIASHSAGLTVPGFRGYAHNEALPTIVQVLNGVPPANSRPIVVDTFPGALVRYSGGGFVVLQQVLLDATRASSFADLVRRQVLFPAGMNQSTYEQPLPASLAATAARGHDNGPVVGGAHTLPEQAAAGLWTTPSDLAHWLVAITDAYAGRSTALLTQPMARQMLTVQKPGAGLGIGVDGDGEMFNVGHSGSNVGFRAFMRVFPAQGEGIVVMTNTSRGSAIAEEIVRAVAAEYGWAPFAPERVTPFALDRAAAQGIVGKYILRVGPGRPVEVKLEGANLTVYGPAAMVHELVAESHTRFVSPMTGWRFEFVRDPSGRATGIKVFHDASGVPIEGSRDS